MKLSLLQVCINQDAIKDGLRVLPVNVMQCKKMLVLCGPTYPMRLWPAAELSSCACPVVWNHVERSARITDQHECRSGVW